MKFIFILLKSWIFHLNELLDICFCICFGQKKKKKSSGLHSLERIFCIVKWKIEPDRKTDFLIKYIPLIVQICFKNQWYTK